MHPAHGFLVLVRYETARQPISNDIAGFSCTKHIRSIALLCIR